MTDEIKADEIEVDDSMVTLEDEVTIEAEAPEVTAAPAADEESEQAPEVDERQKAINKLAFEKREQKRRADDLQRQLDEIAKQNAESVVVPKRPTEEEYDYDSVKFQAAMDDYEAKLVDSRVQKSLMTQREQDIQNRQKIEQREAQERFDQKVVESNIEGYADAIQKLPIFDPSVTSAIMQSDNGVKIAWYLSQNLDKADEIASSNPVVAAMKIGEISARLSSAKPTIKPSKTPDPIETVNQGGAGIREAEHPLLDGAKFE